MSYDDKKKYDEHKYDDIINLPHHVSSKHPPMPALDRAAQFSPFAALTGHTEAIKETARLTEEQIELDEDSKEILNEQLLLLKNSIKNGNTRNNRNNNENIENSEASEVFEDPTALPEVTVTYFKPDEKKTGGSYVTFTGTVKKFNEYERTIIFDSGETILIDRLIKISQNSRISSH